jgi:hypothetical protein
MQSPEVGFTVIVGQPADCIGTVGTTVANQSIEPGLADQRSTITLTLNCVPSA